MKIEIDLNQILGDEYGSTESLAESVRRQVVDQIKKEISGGIKKQIDDEISKAMHELILTEVTNLMPSFIPDLLNAEYETVGRYGERGTKTTFRNEMIKTIQSEMVYKPSKDRYYDKENEFTKAVRSILDAEIEKFKKEFNSVVSKEFTKETIEIVTSELRKKFGF